MSSLTSCVKKAGEYLSAGDRAAILRASQQFRSEGMGTAEAAKAAVEQQIAAVREMLTPKPVAAAAARVADGEGVLNQAARPFIQRLTEAFKRWSNDAPYISGEDAKTHDFKTGEKIVVEAFHGTKRPDRVGIKFLKKRATSGPMAFHTGDPALASSYASGKADTSLSLEDQDYSNWFKVKLPGERSASDLVRSWYRLTPEQKDRIAALAPRVTYSDEQEADGGNKIVLGDESVNSGTGSYDYNLAQTRTTWDRRGNPLKAMVEDWLNSGNLFNDEERFMQVLKLAGFPMEAVEYDSPTSEYPFVYKNYIAMQNPLVTSDIPQAVTDALNAAAKKDRSRAQAGGADMWDKNTRTLREWVANFNDPENNQRAYVWTSIPDKVTEVFKSLGYDGIVDWSGKGGGPGAVVAPVYIPFEESQVKSAIGNKGTFDSSSNILKQGAEAPRAQIQFGVFRVYDKAGTPLGYVQANDPKQALALAKVKTNDDGAKKFPTAARVDTDQTFGLISLLDGADKSSFIHESGHAFLEIQADLARKIQARIDAGEEVTAGQRGIVDDMNRILDWFGITGYEQASGPTGGALDQSNNVIGLQLELAKIEAEFDPLRKAKQFDSTAWDAVAARAASVRKQLFALTGDPYGKAKAQKPQRPSDDALAAEYASPDQVPRDVMRWVQQYAAPLTSDASDAVRWGRIVGTINDERYPPGDLEIFRAVDGEDIRAGDWVSTSRDYAEQHLARYLGGKGRVVSEIVDGADVLVSPTGNSEEAIYAPRGLSGHLSQDSALRQAPKGAALDLWYGADSNLRNADGTPMLLYHGTNKRAAAAIRRDGRISRSKYGAMGAAVYLGDSAEASAGYNDGAMLQVYARGKYLTNKQWTEYVNKHGWKEAEQAARADGWAGVYDEMFENAVAVWDVANIKAVNAKAFVEGGGMYAQGGPDTSPPPVPPTGRTPLDTWSMMSLPEREHYHEMFARGFEQFTMEGVAPSLELQSAFSNFRKWLVGIYKKLANLNVNLTDDVRAVMGRMLASDAAIEEAESARSLHPMIRTAEDAAKLGWSKKKFDAYQLLAQGPTDEAIKQLQTRGMKDMQWLSGARDRAIREKQRENDGLRHDVRQEVRAEVYGEPVYRAWQFLTGKPDPGEPSEAMRKYLADREDHKARRKKAEAKARAEQRGNDWRQRAIDLQQELLEWDRANPAPARPTEVNEQVATGDGPPKTGKAVDASKDSILVAIAKLGGINRDSAKRDLSVHDDDLKIASGVFGAPVFRKTGGRNADDMREALTELGYLHERDEFGRTDLRGLSDAISNEIGGSPEYSFAKDYSEGPRDEIAEFQTYGKLNTADLKSRYGESETAVWRKLSALRMTNEKGLDADVVAEAFGFDSGDALVQALAAAMPPREVIEARTDARMLATHGDINSPEALARAADEAVFNRLRAKFLTREWKALEDATTRKEKVGKRHVDVMAQAARKYAADLVAKLKIREIKPNVFASSMMRNGKAADKAFMAGKTEEAAMHKRNQAINAYATQAAYAGLAEVEKARAYLKKFDKRLKSIDPKYQNQIEWLLVKFDFRKASVDEAQRARAEAKTAAQIKAAEARLAELDALGPTQEREGLTQWLESLGEYEVRPDLSAVSQGVAKSYRDMTLEEMRDLVDDIKRIEHLGRLKNRLLMARDKREFDLVKADVLEAIAASKKGERRPYKLESGSPTVIDRLNGFLTEHRKLSSLIREIDMGNDDGPLYTAIGRSMNAQDAWEHDRNEKVTKRLLELFDPILKMPGGMSGDKGAVFIEAIGTSMTRQGRMSVALNYGNEDGRQRLMSGNLMEGRGNWTDAQIQAVMSTLNPQELAIVNQVWPLLDEFWPEIAAKEERVNGVAPEKVDAAPFSVKASDGTMVQMRGGYYPLVYDKRESANIATKDAKALAEEAMRGATTRSTTKRGHTKERVHGVKHKLRLDLNVIPEHVQQVVHDLAWHEWLIDANKIFRDDEIAQALSDYYGADVRNNIQGALQAIAGGDRAARDHTTDIALMARSNISRAVMGWSLTTAFLQPFGLWQSMARIGVGHVLSGVGRFMGTPKHMSETLAMIDAKSPMMRHRSMTMSRELYEISNIVKGKSKGARVFDASLFYLTTKLQAVADVPTWLGAYNKALQEKPQDEQRAIDLADRAVIEAQGSGSNKDLAAVQRNHPFLVQFMSYFSAGYQIAVEKTKFTDFKNPRAVAGWAGDMALLAILPAILPNLIMHLLKGGDADDPEKLALEMAKWQAQFLLAPIVYFRDASALVAGFDYTGPPATRIFSDLGKLGKQVAQGEADEALMLAMFNVAGDLTGIPTAQISRSYRGWVAWDEGKEGASPVSVLVGPPPKP